MIFSPKKGADAPDDEPASSLFRVVQYLLEACALHSVEFDTDEHVAFQTAIRDLAGRFDKVQGHKDLLILAGETNRIIQTYNQRAEKFIHDLSTEKQLSIGLLTQALIRVCHSSEKTSQNLRQIERDLAKTSQLQDMRQLRAKLSECLATLCQEADNQEAQFTELKAQIAASSRLLEQRDQVTGLNGLKAAEQRVKEIAAGGSQGFVAAFFLKNVDQVNRRFGFSAGDKVLNNFGKYLGKDLRGNDQLFRWRGPCFVVVTDRFASLDEVKSEAYSIGARGPEIDVEGGGRSMLIRMLAATAVFPIPKGANTADLSAKIDQFASEQFKLLPSSG